jgi:YggT family protein
VEILRLVAGIANFLLLVYILLLLARLIMEYIPLFNREWRPRGFGLVLAEIVYTLTDPPIRFFRRLIPPLRIGSIAIDLGFPLTMLACFVLLSIVRVIGSVSV